MAKVNVSNQGIAHAAYTAGGQPLCRNKQAHFSLAISAFRDSGYRHCRRCDQAIARMDEQAAKRAAKRAAA